MITVLFVFVRNGPGTLFYVQREVCCVNNSICLKLKPHPVFLVWKSRHERVLDTLQLIPWHKFLSFLTHQYDVSYCLPLLNLFEGWLTAVIVSRI
jgi:hypothetical protein